MKNEWIGKRDKIRGAINTIMEILMTDCEVYEKEVTLPKERMQHLFYALREIEDAVKEVKTQAEAERAEFENMLYFD